ncbi:MAG: DNA primase [candidate division Zixibacteria bacterium 4484_93]|nr:MAG: DNA primase [candidate division Zixibacteria bacterium 4484_93]
MPDELVEKIRERIRIEEVVQEYTTLKRSGTKLKALCPLHQEKTPSFYVDPDKQLFYCFGCGKGGDIFTFLMEAEGLTFPEAVERLAKRAGISLDKRSSRSRSIKSKLVSACEFANTYFRNILTSSEGNRAREYLKRRGILPETAEKFQLGYSNGGLLQYAKNHSFPIEPLVSAGILIKKENLYERFRKRLIFPIKDVAAKTVGFAGRSLDASENVAKYINSPETPIYHKSDILYGLSLSKREIVRKDIAILVEGYFDIITLFQAGIQNVVASSGTAFTEKQAQILSRFTKNVLLLFDGDEAGKKAALRTIPSLLSQEFNLKVLLLPEGKDPDDFVRKNGVDTLTGMIEKAPDFFSFLVDEAKNRGYDISRPNGKRYLINFLKEYLSSIKSEATLFIYLEELSRITGVPVDIVRQEFAGSIRKEAPTTIRKKKTKKELDRQAILEISFFLIASCLPEVARKEKEKINLEYFYQYPGIAKRVLERLDDGKPIPKEKLPELFTDLASKAYIVKEIFAGVKFGEPAFNETLKRLKLSHITRRLKTMESQIEDAEMAGDTAKIEELTRAYSELSSERGKLL